MASPYHPKDFKARFYDLTIKRFLNADPIGYGDGLNRAFREAKICFKRVPLRYYFHIFIFSYQWVTGVEFDAKPRNNYRNHTKTALTVLFKRETIRSLA